MTCINNGSSLTDNQIEMLSMMIKNKERLGMAICSCDIQRVFGLTHGSADAVHDLV